MESETPEQQAPVEAPAVSKDAGIEELLAQFEQDTAKPEPTAEPQGVLSNEEIDNLINGIDPSAGRVKELEGILGQRDGELNALKAEQLWKAEREAFDGFSKKLQEELGPNVPDDYARTQLIALASEKPELEIAWRHRNITNEQLAAADAEFRQLEALHYRVSQSDDPRKGEVIAQLESRGRELGYMLNARTMLNNAWKDVVSRSRKVAPPIDESATADRAMVAQSVRDAGGFVPDPPPRLGNLTDQEYRKYLKDNFGIAGF